MTRVRPPLIFFEIIACHLSGKLFHVLILCPQPDPTFLNHRPTFTARTGKPAGFFQSGGLFRPELAALRGLSCWERPKDLPIQSFGSVLSASLALEAGQVEEVNGGDAVSVSGGNVANTASHCPDDRGGDLEGGSVSTHAEPTRRSSRLANRGSIPASDGRPNQNMHVRSSQGRVSNPDPALHTTGASTPSAPQAQHYSQESPSQGHNVRTGHGRRATRNPGIPKDEEHAPAFFAKKRERQQRNNPKISRKTRAHINLCAININGRKQDSISHPDHKWHSMNRLMFDEKIGILVVGETHLSAQQAEEIQEDSHLGRRMDIYHSSNPKTLAPEACHSS
ncbi:hypothetical protein B0H13DRAFT_1896605 [Mycena leptocephala]|nr:hypothetical protein B0H13DRAFT_1896605 [Mycena leptocephala]